jgi:hypothetical protein
LSDSCRSVATLWQQSYKSVRNGSTFSLLFSLGFSEPQATSFLAKAGLLSALRRADRAVPKWGSADLSRSAELQFAAQVVRLGPHLGVAWSAATPTGRPLQLIRRRLAVRVEAGPGFTDGLAVKFPPIHSGQSSESIRTAVRRRRKTVRQFAGSLSELNRQRVRFKSDACPKWTGLLSG